MFRRHFSELLNGLYRDGCFETVEIYHRVRLEEIQVSGVKRRGCAAMTAVRTTGPDGIREVRLTDQLPHIDTVRTLLDIAMPMSSAGKQVMGAKVGAFCHRHVRQDDQNWRGLCRDILVNSSGAELLADCDFSLYRNNGIAASSDPGYGALADGRRDVLFLSPAIVMAMVRRGGFRGTLARGRATSLFHGHFDGVGTTSWNWSRTPRTLHLTSGTLLFADLKPAKGLSGSRLATVVRDGQGWRGWTVDGYTVRFRDDVLESVEKVTEDVICFDGELYWRLPVVAVQGDLKWD